MTEGETRALVARLRKESLVYFVSHDLVNDPPDHDPEITWLELQELSDLLRAAADRLAVCLDVAREMRVHATARPSQWSPAQREQAGLWADRLAGLPAPATQEPK